MLRNKEKISLLVFIFFVHHATGYFRLTEEQFAMMPPLIHVDRFSHCVNNPGGIYCTTHADVVADKPNPIHFMMVNFTNAAKRHYDFTNILYGLCMTDTCKHHLKGNTTPELIQTAEACLNESLGKKYDLGVRVEKVNCYRYKENKYKEDYIDTLVYYALGGILALNAIATVYDVIFEKKDQEGLLLSFSLRANWRKLVAAPSTEPRKATMVGINGIRGLLTLLVILGHAPMAPLLSIENPQWLEEAFENIGLQILFQGHITTQFFFVMSGLLLTYNVQLVKETRKITWTMLPKGIFLRWLRLAPVNIVIMALTATWLRFTPYGPFWQENLGVEVHDCRVYWPSVVFYYNNYVDNSVCSLQTWSMACDMHLHIIGIALVILAPSAKARNRALLALFAISLLLPALEVYFGDMDGSLLVVAHALRYYMTTIPSFKYLHIRTHTNISSFVIGMYFGHLIYDLQLKPIAETTRKRLSKVYWTVMPLILLVTVSTFLLFLGDGPRAPLWLRILFSVMHKPVIGLLAAFLITGLVIRVEGIPIYKWFFESSLWMPISRISYGIFATHVIVIRYLGARKATLSYVNNFSMVQDYVGIVAFSIVLGFILYMLVEAPFGQLVKLLFMFRFRSKKVGKDIDESGASKNVNPTNAKVDSNFNGKQIKAE